MCAALRWATLRLLSHIVTPLIAFDSTLRFHLVCTFRRFACKWHRCEMESKPVDGADAQQPLVNGDLDHSPNQRTSSDGRTGLPQRTPSIKQNKTFQILDIKQTLSDGDDAVAGGSANASNTSQSMLDLEVSAAEQDPNLTASPLGSGSGGGRRPSFVVESDLEASPRSAASELSPQEFSEPRDGLPLSGSGTALGVGTEPHDGLGPPKGPSRFKVSKVAGGDKGGLGKTVRRQRFEVIDLEATATSGHMQAAQHNANRGTSTYSHSLFAISSNSFREEAANPVCLITRLSRCCRRFSLQAVNF